MNKKMLVLAILAMVAVLVIAFVALKQKQDQNPEITKQQLLPKFQTLKTQYEEAKAQGLDVSEVEGFVKQAKQAFDRGDYKKANELLDKAFVFLEKTKISAEPIPEVVKEEARAKFSQVKIAVLYDRVTDGVRNIGDVINIFKELNPDFIYRGWWEMYPIPESQNEAPGFFTKEEIEELTRRGYTYEQLSEAITAIKKEMPNVIFSGSLGAEYIFAAKVRDPITGETFGKDKTWDMALDPSKWGINISKMEFQRMIAIRRQNMKPGETFNPEKMPFYYPDITNPDFQKLFLDLAENQIDSGVDSIWFDLLTAQAEFLAKTTGDPYHPAVKESYEAASKIVDEVHKYGYTKYGKYITIGDWEKSIYLPYPPLNLDYITLQPLPYEISNEKLDEKRWNGLTNSIRKKYGKIPIFIYMDWGHTDETSLALFSQRSTEKQREMLEMMDKFFSERGFVFIYPLHGGSMGPNTKKLSYGEFKIYDALAPELDTYKTIKELAQKKAKGE